jgi:hypothetical protein
MTKRNPAVSVAYRDRFYTDKSGTTWRRGLDGWFDDSIPGIIHLIGHDEMAKVIEQENPE